MTLDQSKMKRARFALGRLPAGTMNKSEAAYDAHLAAEQVAGRVLWRRFEGIRLKLAELTYYSPDFVVLCSDGVLECHEVKGYWGDDDRAKIKVAAEMYPLRFIAVRARAKKHGGGWERETFGREPEVIASPSLDLLANAA